MARNMHVIFIGTSSGGGPSLSRNCSSIVVDCAEGTVRQFQTQPRGNESRLRAMKITKLFVTHMHADHVMGIVPFLRHVLRPPPIVGSSDTNSSLKKPPSIEIYGPAGLRSFVRTVLSMTFTRTADTYAVHELLTPTCSRTPCDTTTLHPSESSGSDLVCGEDGFWRHITSARGRLGDVVVDAGPIIHRVPCLGYVFREPSFPHRKLAMLGDTCDASSIIPLLTSPSPSLLVHEATDAFISSEIDPQAKRSREEVEQKVSARGHSTPAMAGEFAKRVGAERLILNHIGSRFPAPRQYQGEGDVRFSVIDEISRQASEAWGMGRAEVAFDYMRVTIPEPRPVFDMNVVIPRETQIMQGEHMEQEWGDDDGNQGMPWRGSSYVRRGREPERGRYHTRRRTADGRECTDTTVSR
ncbi:beta-lactamase-like protein [Pisolithus marmoratus]|nr:beta-lactamase-like protein [Pisolithus marmoratus]